MTTEREPQRRSNAFGEADRYGDRNRTPFAAQGLPAQSSGGCIRIVNLSLADEQHVKAAEGWLELGLFREAFEELEHIAPEHRVHPDVLKLRWQVYAKAEKWGNAFTVAEGLARLVPDDVQPFIWRSYSARRMKGGGVLHAFELLQDVVRDFPDEPVVPFNLACYCCQLGRMPQAQSWLHIAFEIAQRNGTEQHWKTKAQAIQSLLNVPNPRNYAVVVALENPPFLPRG